MVQRQHIGPAIRRLRLERGLTLDTLAEASGISASHLSRLERSQTLPSFTVLAKISEALGVNVDAFVHLERDVAQIDDELIWFLEQFGFETDQRNEFLTLSIETRRDLVGRLRALAEAPITPRIAQEAAAAAVSRQGIPAAWDRVEHVVRESGLRGVAFTRALLLLLPEAAGRRVVVIGNHSFFLLPRRSDFVTSFRGVFGAEPVDPAVVSWWEAPEGRPGDWIADGWPTRIVVSRHVLANIAATGRFMPAASASHECTSRLLGHWADRLTEDRGFEMAITEVPLGPGSFLSVGDQIGLVECLPDPSDEARKAGLLLSGPESVGAFTSAAAQLWDSLPAEDKDRQVVVDWLRSHAGQLV